MSDPIQSIQIVGVGTITRADIAAWADERTRLLRQRDEIMQKVGELNRKIDGAEFFFDCAKKKRLGEALPEAVAGALSLEGDRG